MMKTTSAAVVAAIALFCAPMSMAQAETTDIAAQQLLVDRFNAEPMQLLDVRTSEEYQQGHIKGAINISHTVLADHLGELDKERPIVVYCRSGRRAAMAIDILQEQGFKQVYHLEGDWLGWQKQQLPEITQP
ncbi:rhodanese-like domain-containing protein [Pseudoalteromonas sp. T1lg48]|uniref:rhodanese-like domain-containing protein n=1 Tax=Pseudoalteromonas sp. T1lg48 TaxID=2077100 RepID=UPI000CF705A0|nr:rhodanese-like domain-containing protein [Pseudoalteromonas sp. T1lg48]